MGLGVQVGDVGWGFHLFSSPCPRTTKNRRMKLGGLLPCFYMKGYLAAELGYFRSQNEEITKRPRDCNSSVLGSSLSESEHWLARRCTRPASPPRWFDFFCCCCLVGFLCFPLTQQSLGYFTGTFGSASVLSASRNPKSSPGGSCIRYFPLLVNSTLG